jgi:hypothetical protein
MDLAEISNVGEITGRKLCFYQLQVVICATPKLGSSGSLELDAEPWPIIAA